MLAALAALLCYPCLFIMISADAIGDAGVILQSSNDTATICVFVNATMYGILNAIKKVKSQTNIFVPQDNKRLLKEFVKGYQDIFSIIRSLQETKESNIPKSVETLQIYQAAASVLTTVHEYVQQDRIALIHDNCNSYKVDIYFHELKKKFYVHKFRLNITMIGLRVTESIVHDILQLKISSIIMLLPREICILFLDIANTYGLLLLQHYTWFLITKNIGKPNPIDRPCMQLFDPSSMLSTSKEFSDSVISSAISHLTNCNISTTAQPRNSHREHRVTRELIKTVENCKNEKPTLRLATLIELPYVGEVYTPTDSRGHVICTTSYPCSLPVKGRNETFWRNTCCTGFAVELFNLIATDIDIKFEIYGVEDETYGSPVNGSWTGIYNDVYTGKADVGLQGLFANQLRNTIVDFTESFSTSKLGIIRRVNQEEMSSLNWKALRFLKVDLIIALGVSFAVVCVCMFVYENLINFLLKMDYYETRETFSYGAGIMLQRDLGGKTPSKWSSRIIAIVFAIAMTIVMTTYTANLTANNIHGNSDDFLGIRDKKISNPTPKFKYGVIQNSFFESFFKMRNDNEFRRIYQFLQNYLTKSITASLDKVMSSELDAFIGDYTYLLLHLTQAKYCNVLSLYEENVYQYEVAFAIRKNSAWKERISASMRKLKETEKFSILYNKWFFLPACLIDTNSGNKLAWQYASGLLLGLACCLVLCVLILLCENIYSYLHTRKHFREHSRNSRQD